ncbi:MAG: hypothetical protein Q7R84_01395 [bacterium]|nr:hypothetical protein [bacterium]
MFKLIYGFKDVGEYQTFPEAFKELFERLNKIIKKGTSYQIFNTIWIEYNNDEGMLNFNGIVCLAREIGLIKEDSGLQDIVLDPDKERLIVRKFLSGKLEAMTEELEMIAEIVMRK